METNEAIFFVGTYTEERANPGEGIYTCRLDLATGALRVEGVTPAENPSFLAIDPTGKLLLAANEVSEGRVTIFSIDRPSGRLTPLNSQPTQGRHPCYASFAPGGRFALAANYSSGSIAVFPVQAGGSLSPASFSYQFEGKGPNANRQDGPHAHCILPAPGGPYVLVADLGRDVVEVLRLEAETATLQPHDSYHSRSGSGPRHLAFAGSGRFAYLVHELDSTVTTLAYSPDGGRLEALQALSTLPEGWPGENTAADIHLTPSGDFLYVSNRGHDSLAIFASDADTGALTTLGHISCGGRTPRNFAIHPGGETLLAANQDSHTIVAFRLDPVHGDLIPTGNDLSIPYPVCIQFL